MTRTRSAARPALILPVVLVVIGLLAMTIGGFIFFVRAETAGAIAHSDTQQARLAMESGLEEVIALLRADKHNFKAWYDLPKRLRHVLVYSPAYEREGDPVRQQGSRKELLEPGKVITPAWRYSAVAESYAGLEESMRYGITPEAGKLNLNAATEAQITDLLLPLLADLGVENPQEIVAATLDWLDPDSQPREGGAEDGYYNTLKPAYRAKNGPLDSVEELLLIKGFTARLLYGEDVNRNGLMDANENDGDESPPRFDNRDGNLDRGVASFVTIWSREPDTALDNKPRINLNLDAGAIQAQLATTLQDGQLSDASIQFILGLKQQGFDFSQLASPAQLYPLPPDDEGPAPQRPDQPVIAAGSDDGKVDNSESQEGESQGDETDGAGEQGEGAKPGDETEDEQAKPGSRSREKSADSRSQNRSGGGKPGKEPQPADEPAEEEGEKDDGTGGEPMDEGGGKQPGGQRPEAGRQPRPPAAPPGADGQPGQPQQPDLSALAASPITLDELPVIMDRFSVRTGGGQEGIVGLINLNTAPARVLALIPDMKPETAAALVEARGRLSAEQLQTTAWPVVSGVISVGDWQRLAPHVTTKSYQFRVEIVGYSDHLKLFRRGEWIIEMIGPLAQIRYQRDLTPLGMAWPVDSEQVIVTNQ